MKENTGARDWTWQAIGACERALSAALLAAFLPAVVAAGAAMAVSSKRSPLIAHRRVGWRGETLWMVKLRTMWDDAGGSGAREFRWVEYIEDGPVPEQKIAEDARVGNRLAAFLRRHSIDEVPQFWHVLRGEMSLVGPRPITVGELTRYYGAAAEEMLRVKPGMAGLWQTSGRARLGHEDRRELDLRYVRERSLGMYLRILVRRFRKC